MIQKLWGVLRNRCLISLVAVSMLLSFLLVHQSATPIAQANNSNGGWCESSTVHIGDNSDINKFGKDHGVATWVGGNMFIGAPYENQKVFNKDSWPQGSYAVEAEGLTLINGKLISRAIKGGH